ncbi:YTH domain-containing protein ECT2-like [Prosopis cineraria]|uniref:YTH domain-containing protein ECT2-like n=1 Tax=Prosopis cineraria TaxID=364024 RepID=UPI00240FDC64|nr:YTH domain-containing protein ECT2-like [Prosopis cineraria]
MATAAPADQAANFLQKLSVDTQAKALEIPEPTKNVTGNQCELLDSSNTANDQIPSCERSITPLLQDFDPAMCYVPNGYPSAAYFYGGYDGAGNDWDDYSRFVNPDGVELPSGVYGDNGSLVYHHGYGYAPYGPYSPAGSPVPTIANDGQLYGPQHYQYSPYFQPLAPTSASFTPTSAAPPQGEVSSSLTADQKPVPVEGANGNSNGAEKGGRVKGRNVAAPEKLAHKNSSFSSSPLYRRGATMPGCVPPMGYQDPRYGFDGLCSHIPWLDAPLISERQPRPVTSAAITSISGSNNVTASRSHNFCLNSQFMGLHHPRPLPAIGATHGFINRMYPSELYGHYGNTIRSGMDCGMRGYDSQGNGRAWLAVDSKYKIRGRSGYYGSSNENIDGLNELNRGPRAKCCKSQKVLAPIALSVKGQNLHANLTNDMEKDKTWVIPDRDQYNKADFLEEYTDAKFFIIKSYSEDDIHKSIKYNVWASTQIGNKKLDAAFQESQKKPGACPVFLFFSVNTSGQFVGLAEMIGPVDFNKSVEYWQQDKWNGCFPLKWHMVKDVPNNLLRHITLENNENKPVTNSRDSQEVMLEPGLKMIKIFKEHASKTCILDDFAFYEDRQKTILEKKVKLQFPKQVWEGKATDGKTELSAEVKTQNSNVPAVILQECNLAEQNSDGFKFSENSTVAKMGDVPKGAKAVVAESKISNGVANGY